MLKAIPENEKQNWKHHLPKLMFAYNGIVNKVTGYSSFFLMVGRSSRLPIDSMFPCDEMCRRHIVNLWRGGKP